MTNIVQFRRDPYSFRTTIERSHYAHGKRFAPNLYTTLEEEQRIARVYADVMRDERILRWQSRIKWTCIFLAVFLACYFGGEFSRVLI